MELYAGNVRNTAQKMKFPIKDFFSKCDQKTADLVTFTEEILNGKLHFFYSGKSSLHIIALTGRSMKFIIFLELNLFFYT